MSCPSNHRYPSLLWPAGAANTNGIPIRCPRRLLRMIFLGSLLAGFLLVLHSAAYAETLVGEVVGLVDGDTVSVRATNKVIHKIRIAGIDAPEKPQPFAGQSRQRLADLVFRKQVIVDWHKTDRYGRIIGKVSVGDVDAGLEQIRAGMAWHYKQYAHEQSPEDRDIYSAAEDLARQNRIGLWRHEQPVAPWKFRRAAARTDRDR